MTESIKSIEPRRPFRFLRYAIIGVIAGPIASFCFCGLVMDLGLRNDVPKVALVLAVLFEVLAYLGIGITVVSSLYIIWWLLYWLGGLL